MAVGGDGEPDQQAACITRCLLHAVGSTFGLGLGFENGQRDAAVAQEIVGNNRLRLVVHRLGRIAGEIDAARADTQLLFPVPPGTGEGWFDQLFTGCTFVSGRHDMFLLVAISKRLLKPLCIRVRLKARPVPLSEIHG